MSEQVLSPLKTAATTEGRILRRVLALAMPAAILAAIFVPTNLSPVWRLYDVPASSMAPGYPVGTYLIVSRLSYGLARRSYDWFDLPITGRWPAWLPKRGDVVVFRLPRDQRVQYIKRLIGLPGDTVQMRGGQLYIDGQAVPKRSNGIYRENGPSPRRVDRFTEVLPDGARYDVLDDGPNNPLDDTPEFKVPPGHYFVMGDNRDNSVDSRMGGPQGVGFVPAELLIGKVVASF